MSALKSQWVLWVAFLFIVALIVFETIDNIRLRREVRRMQMDMGQEMSILRSAVAELASRTDYPTPSRPATVELNAITEGMIGTWASEGTPVITITKKGGNVVITSLPDDTWRTDFYDARIVGNSIHYTSRSFLRSREFHPFSGKAHQCYLTLEGPDILLSGSADEPDEELEELLGGEPFVDRMTRVER